MIFSRKSVLALLAALTTFLVASDAFAAAFYLPGRGVKPLGRAGAYVASSGGDLNALWYNPANLGLLEDTTLTVDLALIGLDFEFQRAPRTAENGETIEYEKVENEAPPKLDPQILIGGPTPVEDLTWSFGIYAPYLSGHTFPEDGPQRYVLVDNDQSLLAFLHLAAAYNLGDHVRFGLGFQNILAKFVLINVTSAYTGLFGRPEDEDLDILSEITLENYFNPSGNAGIWVKFAPMIEAGLSVQLPFVIEDDDATLRVRMPDHPAFDNAELEGNTLEGSIKFPAVIRLGLRYTHEKFDVELAGTYEGWSIFDEISANPNDIAVTGVPGLGSIPVGPLSIPQNWEDTFSVRLGSDISITETFTGRLGYAFETAAVPDERYSVFLADANKHLITGGSTYQIGESFELDASLAFYAMESREITNSKVRQINPTDTEDELTTIVGNGSYSQTYVAGGLGMNYRF